LLPVRTCHAGSDGAAGSTDDTDDLLILVVLKSLFVSSGAESGLLSLNLKIAQQ
jgi:hypothetical protein